MALDVAERVADGQASDNEHMAACEAVDKHLQKPGMDLVTPARVWALRLRAVLALDIQLSVGLLSPPHQPGSRGGIELLREVLGNPFSLVAISTDCLRWNGSTIYRIAQEIYADHAFEQLPILADALEDAGCTDVGLLDHFRGPGPHVRGCWALDVLLTLAERPSP
jgi:hypothetical protein